MSPSLLNFGNVNIRNNSKLTLSTFTQHSGSTFIGNGANIEISSFQLMGGILEGFGSITGTLSHTDGEVRPGGQDSIGTLSANGYTQSSSSAVIEIEAASSSVFDTLSVGTGGITLSSGLLRFKPIVSYTPGICFCMHFKDHSYFNRFLEYSSDDRLVEWYFWAIFFVSRFLSYLCFFFVWLRDQFYFSFAPLYRLHEWRLCWPKSMQLF